MITERWALWGTRKPKPTFEDWANALKTNEPIELPIKHHVQGETTLFVLPYHLGCSFNYDYWTFRAIAADAPDHLGLGNNQALHCRPTLDKLLGEQLVQLVRGEFKGRSFIEVDPEAPILSPRDWF